MTLTLQQLESYERDGFVVLPDFASAKQLADLKNEADSLLLQFKKEFESSTDGASTGQVFSTNGNAQITSEYFIGSSDKVRFFFEEGAMSDCKGDGAMISTSGVASSKTLQVEFTKAINKIGHSLHTENAVFGEFTAKNEKLTEILRSLKFRSPVILQSMIIFKQPRIGGAVFSHQDSTFLHTTPLSTVGFWMPVEDALLENGCLYFIPGSHKKYPINKSLVRNPAYFQDAELKVPKPNVDDVPLLVFEDNGEPHKYEDSEFIPVELKAGSMVVFDGSVVHKSFRNTSDKRRLAYTFHCVEIIPGEVAYDNSNWLQLPEFKPHYTTLTQ